MLGIISYHLSTKVLIKRIKEDWDSLMGRYRRLKLFFLHFLRLNLSSLVFCNFVLRGFKVRFYWFLTLHFVLFDCCPFSGGSNRFFEILDWVGASFPEFVENHSCGRCSYLKASGGSCNREVLTLDQFHQGFTFLSSRNAYF